MASLQSLLRRSTAERVNRRQGVQPVAVHDHDDHALAHPVPVPILLGTLLALLLLTVVTVMATWVDLGKFNVWLALLIAVVKAAFVCLIFMHLRWDNPFNGVVVIASLLFVALFIAIAITDSAEYSPDIKPSGKAPKPPAVSVAP
jgi:cytochrome c oxidase subunit 4